MRRVLRVYVGGRPVCEISTDRPFEAVRAEIAREWPGRSVEAIPMALLDELHTAPDEVTALRTLCRALTAQLIAVTVLLTDERRAAIVRVEADAARDAGRVAAEALAYLDAPTTV